MKPAAGAQDETVRASALVGGLPPVFCIGVSVRVESADPVGIVFFGRCPGADDLVFHDTVARARDVLRLRLGGARRLPADLDQELGEGARLSWLRADVPGCRVVVRAHRHVVRGHLATLPLFDLQQPVYRSDHRDADLDADPQPQERLLSGQLFLPADPAGFSGGEEPDAQRRIRADRLEHDAGAVPHGVSGDAGAHAGAVHEGRVQRDDPAEAGARQNDQAARAAAGLRKPVAGATVRLDRLAARTVTDRTLRFLEAATGHAAA